MAHLSVISLTVSISVLLAGSVAANEASSLLVCPFDTAVYPGETVHLRCATESGHLIRWYRGTDYTDVVYSGTKLYREGLTDDRYDVRDDGNGSVDLYITAVKPADAAVYMCYDMTTSVKAVANLVVVDPLMKCSQTVNSEQQSTDVDHTCSFVFHGHLEPTVDWLDESGHLLSDVSSRTNATGHVIVSTTTDQRAVKCRLTFELLSCGNFAQRLYFPTKQQSISGFLVSYFPPVNAIVLYVWAISTTVVVFVLAGVICCKRFKTKNRKIQDSSKCPDYYSALQYDNIGQHEYDLPIKAPPGDNQQPSTQQEPPATEAPPTSILLAEQ